MEGTTAGELLRAATGQPGTKPSKGRGTVWAKHNRGRGVSEEEPCHSSQSRHRIGRCVPSMFLKRKSISRRTMLKSSGVTLALPFLESMVPAQVPLRKTAASPRSRLVCIEMVHGAAGSTTDGVAKHYWSPQRAGTDFDFSYTLQPLSAFRDVLTIVSNTDARQAEAQAPTEGGADHFRSSAVYLTGAHAKQTAGLDVFNGPSIDQIYAQRFGRDTQFPSLQVCVENIGLTETCGFNYNCIYSETISWASATEPVPMTVNPRVAFEQLFGKARNRSVIDGVGEAVAQLGSELGPPDRARLDAYLDQIRAIERRIESIEKHNAESPTRERIGAPLGVPDSWEEHVKLMFDLQVLALESETTRVSAFKMSHDTSNRIFPNSGVRTPFHSLSHHAGKPELLEEFAKLNRYHVGLLPYFLEKLRSTPDGDGNLLDHALILYGSPMGDSDMHDHRRLPILIAGHACGALKGNLHYVAAEGTPHANTLLTILHKLGVELPQIGDSTAEIAV